METYEVLERALALIEDKANWCGNGWGNSDQRCMVQAIEEVTGRWPVHEPAWLALADLTFAQDEAHTPGLFNDTHSHAEVVALFQEAIRNEKAKAGVPVEVPAEVAEAVA